MNKLQNRLLPHDRDASMGGKGHCCCHFTLRNEEITLELLAALLSSVLNCAFHILQGLSFWNVTTQPSSARAEEFMAMEKRGPERNGRKLQVRGWTACSAGKERVKRSENGTLESALRFIFLSSGYDGIHLSLSVCISPEWCALTALRSMRNTVKSS